ncbi:MAG: hypothetical protein KME45_22790 [Stenomitos rutilans HA7619-LM2]|jgi:hypothetical protein|nr:hypothetical protein [Stenomitos rutilans HA7619-LM2]
MKSGDAVAAGAAGVAGAATGVVTASRSMEAQSPLQMPLVYTEPQLQVLL